MRNDSETITCVACNTGFNKYNIGHHVKMHGYQNLSDYKKFYNIDQKKSKICKHCNVEFMPIKKSKQFCTLRCQQLSMRDKNFVEEPGMVTCAMCNMKAHDLTKHIFLIHNIAVEQYKQTYNVPVISDKYVKNQSLKTAGENNPMHHNFIRINKVSNRKPAYHKKTYDIWNAMKQRCYNQTGKLYDRYGGRGIVVCDRWLNSYENFVTDMGEVPDGYSIERNNIDDNYCPENCKWIPRGEQILNTSVTIKIEYLGKTQTMMQWCREFGLKYNTVFSRYSKGWTVPEIFKQPKTTHKI